MFLPDGRIRLPLGHLVAHLRFMRRQAQEFNGARRDPEFCRAWNKGIETGRTRISAQIAEARVQLAKAERGVGSNGR